MEKSKNKTFNRQTLLKLLKSKNITAFEMVHIFAGFD